MKNQKKHTTTAEAIPGLMADGEAVSPNEGQRLGVATRTRLRLYRLETAEEKAALHKLCSGVRNKRGFKRIVLAELQLIADTVSSAKASKFPPDETKPSKILRDLERRAKSVRKFAEKMKKPIRTEGAFGIGFILPQAPLGELHRYADSLEEIARRRWSSSKKPPRKRPRPETRFNKEFAQFVRGIAGSPRWDSLAVLLRRPTGVVSLNMASLRVFVSSHKAKARPPRLLSFTND